MPLRSPFIYAEFADRVRRQIDALAFDQGPGTRWTPPRATKHFAQPYPVATCPLIPRTHLDRPEQQTAMADGIHFEVDRMAAARGLRRGRLSRGNIARLIPGLPDAAAAEITVNPRHADLRPEVRPEVRVRAAARFKETIVREVAAQAKTWRHSRLYTDSRGRPGTIISFMALAPTDGFADSLADRIWLSASWGLENHFSARFWYVGMFEVGLELCRPGCSIFGEDGGGRLGETG